MSNLRNLLPIRKIAVVALGGGLTWAAQRLGLDLGSTGANEAATVVVGLAFGYLERDPRVIGALKGLETAAEEAAQDAPAPAPVVAPVAPAAPAHDVA